MLLFRSDKLRPSPHKAAVEVLLAALPDYDTLLGGSGLSPIEDLEALLIATANPRSVTATFLAARYKDSERLRGIASRPLQPGDPRVFRTLAPGLTARRPSCWRPASPPRCRSRPRPSRGPTAGSGSRCQRCRR